ncbi:putative bifunctional diguanylate cyclase/phosphodiesterase [Hirschia litorea]|uniref:Bifunctional diguanylate cyclase/phosphodiesterase n=1 Tax=Hirschia litorea TaxID=1199156 RepID=A0ABW2IK77_9PROT
MISFKKIQKAIQAYSKKNLEEDLPLKSLFVLFAAVVGFMFAVLYMVSQHTDEIAKKQQNHVFTRLLENHIDITQDMLEFIIRLPDTEDMLSGNMSKTAMNTKIAQRFADRIATTDILVTNGDGNILFSGSSYRSIYPLDIVEAKPKIAELLSKLKETPEDNFLSDRLILNDDVFQLSVRKLPYEGPDRFLWIATPLSNIFEDTQRIPLDIILEVGTKLPKSTKLVFVGPLNNLNGDTLGWLSWERKLPGYAAIWNYIPALAIATFCLIMAAFFFWSQARTIMKDMSRDHKDAESRALHDPLTGLANRTLLKQQIEAAQADVSRGREDFALHLIDLDKFKDVNDTMGHPAGDELIRQAAQRLRDACRAGDTVARIGGDEFAVIQVEATTSSTASRLARRINEQMSRAFNIDSNEVFVSASIGIAQDIAGKTELEELMRRADIALYRAKAKGRNQFCFFEKDMDVELQAKHKIETDLRLALLEPLKNGLKVVYQPQVSADGRHIRGMEALIRWTHPERGSVSPADFIPIAEESNLIATLDEFVLREAFQTSVKWPNITMAVNVSAKELHDESYPKRVISLAREYNVRPDQIELEITESVLLEDSPRVTRTLKTLKAAGFKIALDDFGTGYSSLAYLRRHQVDKLKIDQSFVASIGVREDASAVVQAILSLGASLGLSVTAEGVETAHQRDSLRAQGCAYLQGYLFSRPLEKQHIAAIMHKFSARNQKQQKLRKIS